MPGKGGLNDREARNSPIGFCADHWPIQGRASSPLSIGSRGRSAWLGIIVDLAGILTITRRTILFYKTMEHEKVSLNITAVF